MFIRFSLAMSLLSGCHSIGYQSRLAAETAQKPFETITDCVTTLSPRGPIKNQSYAGVVLSHRSCVGAAPVLTKAVRKTRVSIVDGSGNRSRSLLYAKNNLVQIKVKDQAKTIGKIIETDKGRVMKLTDRIDYRLMIEDNDSLREWRAKDSVAGDREEIVLYL